MPEGGAGREGGERIPQLSPGRVAACLRCETLEKGPFALPSQVPECEPLEAPANFPGRLQMRAVGV